MEPFIHRDNVACCLLTIFTKGLKSLADWEQLLREAGMYAEVEDNTNKEGKATKEEEDHDTAMEDGDFKESPTIMSGMDEVEYDDIEINIEWDYEELEDYDWLPMARAYCNPLKLVVDALKTTLRTIAKKIRELEQRMRAGQGSNDVKVKAALQALIPKHSSLAKAVTATLEVGDPWLLRILRCCATICVVCVSGLRLRMGYCNA